MATFLDDLERLKRTTGFKPVAVSEGFNPLVRPYPYLPDVWHDMEIAEALTGLLHYCRELELRITRLEGRMKYLEAEVTLEGEE